MQKTIEQIELEKLIKRITTRFHKACADYKLIADGDKILVGLSGGKDSLALVELLGRRQRIHVPRFSVVAAHVSVEEINYQSDLDYLRHFCEEQGVQFIHRTTSIYSNHTPDEDFPQTSTQNRKAKNHCFLCSWYRRKALFDTARELGCNKIALGHHKDDIVETLLMNLIFQGTFATIPPSLQMDKFPMTLIRPLCLVKEEDLKHLSGLRGYKQMPKLCPFEHESSRAEVEKLLHELKSMNPNVLDSIWGAMENIKFSYLPH